MKTSSLNLSLLFLALTMSAVVELVQPGAIPLSTRSTVCSKNMPCKWSVCPWTPRYPILTPDDSCVEINNHCSCPYRMSCSLSPRYLEPLSTSDRDFIKFDYICSQVTPWPN